MKPILICSSVLIFFFSCISSIKSQPFHLNDLTLKESKFTSGDTNKINLTEKSPLFAGALSFIIPGLALGQFYNEQIFKGMLHVGISGIGFFLFVSSIGPEGDSKGKTFAITGILLFLTNWLYTTFDAMYSAEQINKQVKMQKYRSNVLDKLKFGFSVDKNKQLNFKFALEL